jgi:cytochrome c-type biogenesis protein CcmH
MTLGLIIGAMTLIAALALALPLLRERSRVLDRRHHDEAIYRDQLKEVESEARAGVLSAREAEAARAEIGRRLIAAACQGDETQIAPSPLARRAIAPAVLAVSLPAAAAALYLSLGAPHLPGQPLAGRQLVQVDTQRAELEAQLRVLEAKLRADETDEDGWVEYANTLSRLGRHGEAAAAWRKLVTLSGGYSEYAAALGESLVAAAGGTVTPEARKIFDEVLNADPSDPQASFYVGLALVQEGRAREGIQHWLDLIARAPDAPYVSMVRERLERAAREARIDLGTMSASRLAGAPDRDQRREQVRAMVERLAARMEKDTPDDLEGWQRLGRSYGLLGEHERAQAALGRAAALAPDKVDVQAEYAASFRPTMKLDQPLPPDFVTAMRRVLALDADHPEALWWVGAADAQAGDRASALGLWTRLAERLPANAPQAAALREAIERLRAPN